jgi:hypothetical protein
MIRKTEDHGLEFLLAFDGRVHILERGYWLKFEINRIPGTPTRPHGLRYSFTLHGPGGRRLLGFDNAHGLRVKRGRKAAAYDHWHRTERDPGRPYLFKSAEQLLDDFFDEAERILREHGIDSTVIAVESGEGK